MSDFKRAFGATFSVVAIVLVGLLALSLVSSVSEASGFSSGEFLFAEFDRGVLETEFLGEKFYADFRPCLYAAKLLEPAAVLLPPPVQLLLRLGKYY